MKLTSIKKFAFVLIAAFSMNPNWLHAQSSRNVTVKSFDALTVSSGIDMYITQGNTESLVIKGNEDVIKDVVVEQNGSSIVVKYKEGINWGRLFKNQSIKVYVNFKNLKSLTSSGGSDLYTENTLKADQLSVTASGGSDVKLTLACKDLTLKVSGGSDADIKGSGENMQLTASGGADVDAFGYIVSNAKVSVSGGSDANIHVTKALEAGASGGSDVNYKGSASLKKTTSSKSGDINHVN